MCSLTLKIGGYAMHALLGFLKIAKLVWSACKWLWNQCIGFIIRPVLRQSHQQWLNQRRWQMRWVELIDGVHYKLHLASIVDEPADEESWILIRNAGDTTLTELNVFVEAKRGELVWQEPITLHRLPPGRIAVVKLIQLPIENLRIASDGGIYGAYESFGVHPLNVIRKQCREEYESYALPWHPTYYDLLNGSFFWWNRRRYELSAFKEAQRELLLKLRYHLVGFNELGFAGAGALLIHAVKRRQWRRLPAIALFGGLSQSWLLALRVWVSVILGRITLTQPLPEEAREHVIRMARGCHPKRIVPIQSQSDNEYTT